MVPTTSSLRGGVADAAIPASSLRAGAADAAIPSPSLRGGAADAAISTPSLRAGAADVVPTTSSLRGGEADAAILAFCPLCSGLRRSRGGGENHGANRGGLGKRPNRAVAGRYAIGLYLGITRSCHWLPGRIPGLRPPSPLLRRAQGPQAGAVRSRCLSAASLATGRAEGSGRGQPKAGAAGRASLLTFLARTKKVSRPPGRVPAAAAAKPRLPRRLHLLAMTEWRLPRRLHLLAMTEGDCHVGCACSQ